MYRRSIQCAILTSVALFWVAESVDRFGFLEQNSPEICVSEAELEFDHDELATKCLAISPANCTEELVVVGSVADKNVFEFEASDVSHCYLRGPPSAV